MKKYSFLILIVLVFLLMTACQNESETTGSKKTATELQKEPGSISIQTDEHNRTYVILPISNKEIRCDQEKIDYLKNLSYAALKNAEEKLIKQTKKHSDPSYYFNTKDNALFLCAEVIVKITPPASTSEYIELGCGIDHKHLMFSEPITE